MPTAEVPTIDISPLRGDDGAARTKVAEQIGAACRGSGFFYATGHGIDVQRLQDVVNDFHATMTPQEKFDLAINAYNPANDHVRNGYYMAVEGKKAVESFCYLNPSFSAEHPKIAAGVPLHEVNDWPQEQTHPGFRDFCEDYYWQMHRMSVQIMRAMAVALGKPEDFFTPDLKPEDTLSAVSLIRYPFLENYPPVKTGPDGQLLSFADHFDVSMITVLFQTQVQNLQVETVEGWKDLPTSGEAFLVNCGTYMSYLTHDYFPAPLHRVKFVNAERLSLPFFFHAGQDTVFEPFLPHDHQADEVHEPIAYGDYMEHAFHALIRKNGQT